MKDKPHIFVTGGTGLVGSYLLRYLVKNGNYQKITAIRRKESSMALVTEVLEEVNWIEGDILDMPFLVEEFEDVDVVYHCAAVISFAPKDAEWMKVVNVEGTANIVNACLDQEIQKLVYISSIAAIGRSKDNDHISEANKWQRSPYNSNYAISKYLAEQEVWRGQAEGLVVSVACPSVIYGSGFWNRGPNAVIHRIWNGLPFYAIGATGFVDVRDVAKYLIEMMLSDKASGERFIISGENLTYRNFFNRIADGLSKKKASIPVNRFIAALAWRAEWVKCLFTRKQPLITKETVGHSNRRYYYNNEKSIEYFGDSYTDLSDTIAAMCTQFKASQADNFSPKFMKLN